MDKKHLNSQLADAKQYLASLQADPDTSKLKIEAQLEEVSHLEASLRELSRMNGVNLSCEGFYGAVPREVYDCMTFLREALRLACDDIGLNPSHYLALAKERHNV